MAPYFIASLWHEVVMYNYFNATLFDVRTRSLNALIYSCGRIAASFAFQYTSNIYTETNRRVNALLLLIGFSLLVGFVSVLMVFCGAFDLINSTGVDLTEPKAILMMIIFFCFGNLETYATNLSQFC